MLNPQMQHCIQTLLKGKLSDPVNASGSAYAPSNIALVKYWGKRNRSLNLPVTSSLSVSLGQYGARTTVTLHQHHTDHFSLNGNTVPTESEFAKRLELFLDYFRPTANIGFSITTQLNLPVAAGLASSACGFAALVEALDRLFGWNLEKQSLSILARLGSGSASRSLWHGFVEWQAGTREDGLDSFAMPLPEKWPALCVGLLIFHDRAKAISSRKAMQITRETSTLYQAWPTQVAQDLEKMKTALAEKNFDLLGQTAEHNALSMHATMLSAQPTISYMTAETLAAMHQVWECRHQGLKVYFTQDAGPNLKLLFLEHDLADLTSQFPQIQVIRPFQSN